MHETVSLVIKASFQGTNMLEKQISHIVKMLEKKRFCEVILIFDATETCFIRQYSEPSKEIALSIAESLIQKGIIDKWVVTPTENPQLIEDIYERWFDQKTTETHSIKDEPMYQQLYAFEITKGKYTLQADADVIICRRDWHHDYLKDMINAAESAENVVSVGFNIAHKSNDFKKYSSPMAGENVPEVRICLFNKEHFLSLRPLPNELEGGKFKLTWYRSLQKMQKEKGLVSLRGGDGRTFFIHPQNTMKKDLNFLFGVMEKVEHNEIPEIQFENVDLTGTAADWGLLSTGAKAL